MNNQSYTRAAKPRRLHVKKDDNVVVVSGKDKGKRGKVLVAEPKTGKVIVEGVAIVTKHKKARAMGQPGGIIHQEAAIYASKVMLYCAKCQKGVRVRALMAKDGTKSRVCHKCGEPLDR